MRRQIQPGDLVVYQKTKHSLRPIPHARAVRPAPKGEDYSYRIDKYWTVVTVQPTGEIVVCTRRGKTHTLHAEDPLLRKATWWERLLLRRRFPLTGVVMPCARRDTGLT